MSQPKVLLKDLVSIYRFPRLPSLPVRPMVMERVARIVEQTLGDVELREPGKYDLDETLRVVRMAWVRRRSLSGVERIHLKRTPYVLFWGEKPWLGHNSAFLLSFFAEISRRVTGRVSLTITLLRVFLRTYPADANSFDTLRQGIQTLLKRGAGLGRLQVWDRRCRAYGLLDVSGPQKVAAALFGEAPLTVDQVFEQAGLTGELVVAGFAQATFCQVLRGVSEELKGGGKSGSGTLHRMVDIAVNEGRLRFPSLKGKMAEALLSPFVHKEPADEERDIIKGLLVGQLGHPRLKASAWIGVKVAEQNVLLRWLTKEAIEDFFALFDGTARDRHWRFRRPFWTAFLPYVESAWVVLGNRARDLARTRLPETRGSYASLRGASSDQSVLLLKIQGLTIAEWSHDGSCRIWQGSGSSPPALYRSVYGRYDLTEFADASFVHGGSEAGSWQNNIAGYIFRHTGIRVDEKDYMPSGWKSQRATQISQKGSVRPWNHRRYRF